MSVYQKRQSMRSERETVSGMRMRSDGMKARAGGMPLDAATRSSLESGFGHSLSDIRIHADDHADQLSQDFNADAFTVGQDIYFAQGHYAPASEDGKHLLTHEVAHAVQQRGAQADDFRGLHVPDRHSRSETEAHAAAHAVTRGRPVQVSASGGPVVSRWESGEHMNAAKAGMTDEMKGNVTLANGMSVDPTVLTALMGDLYGKYDKKGNFDPAASWNQMNNADPKEMAKLIEMVNKEAKPGAPLTDASDFEKATRNRPSGTDSYLELAAKNSNHFSAPTADGTDNNMGAYSAFHKMALEAAQRGDMNAARAMEASGDHFLTDRFSSGHNFDKEGAMKASGHDRNGVLANMAVKTAHDDLNENGTMLHNAGGEEWKAYGDGKWADPANEENRKRTAAAVSGSWDELSKVHAGKATADELTKDGYGAFGNIPQFDPKNQERAEAVSRHTSLPGMLLDYGATLPDAALGKAWRAEGHVENVLGDAWDWTKDKAGQAWDAGGRAANWVGREAVAGAHAVENGARAVGHEAVQDAKWVGHEAVQAGKAVGNEVAQDAKWVGHEVSQGAQAVGHGAVAGAKAVGGAVEGAGSWVGGKAKDLWDWL